MPQLLSLFLFLPLILLTCGQNGDSVVDAQKSLGGHFEDSDVVVETLKLPDDKLANQHGDSLVEDHRLASDGVTKEVHISTRGKRSEGGFSNIALYHFTPL